MPRSNRLLWVALATGMIVVPSRAKARVRTATSPEPERPQARQGRRLVPNRTAQTMAQSTSPCGRHQVRVERGLVFVDGRAVRPRDGAVYVVAAPTWRSDGGAVAWVERGAGETRLVVLPDLRPGTDALTWELPTWPSGDRVSWAGHKKVVVGPQMLQPRAVASWSD